MKDAAINSSNLCDQMICLFDTFRYVYSDVADRHGLTKPQVFAIYSIHRAKSEVTMNTLAQELHCDASNVTGIVDRLSAQGWLTRVESARDRRAKILVLTEKGNKLIDDLLETLPTQLGCDKLTAEERANLSHTLHKMCQ